MVRVSSQIGHFHATMADISFHGGKLLGLPEGRLEAGQRLRLNATGVSVNATIRWVRFDTCGVEFNRSLSEQELMLVGKSGWRRVGLH